MDQKGLKIDQNGLQIVFLDQKYLFWSHSHFRTFGLFEYIRISAYLVFQFSFIWRCAYKCAMHINALMKTNECQTLQSINPCPVFWLLFLFASPSSHELAFYTNWLCRCPLFIFYVVCLFPISVCAAHLS